MLLPKQRVAGSNPVSRSNTPHEEETGPPPEPPLRPRSPTICSVSRMTVRRSAATSDAAKAAAAHAAFSPAAGLLGAGCAPAGPHKAAYLLTTPPIDTRGIGW